VAINLRMERNTPYSVYFLIAVDRTISAEGVSFWVISASIRGGEQGQF